MRFIPRALTGLSMMVISVGLLSGGVWRIMNAAPDGGRPSGSTTPHRPSNSSKLNESKRARPWPCRAGFKPPKKHGSAFLSQDAWINYRIA